MSVVLFPPGFAAFQNCFWAEYLFIGHNLNRQSGRENTQKHLMKSSHKHFHLQYEPLYCVFIPVNLSFLTNLCTYAHSLIKKAQVPLHQHQTRNQLFSIIINIILKIILENKKVCFLSLKIKKLELLPPSKEAIISTRAATNVYFDNDFYYYKKF